jgi:hypothetical protein
MTIYSMVVHNSDTVKQVFTSDSPSKLLGTLLKSYYSSDIKERVTDDYNSLMRDSYGDDYKNLEVLPDEDITLYMISSLYHDGDSEDGYKLFVYELIQ